MINPSSLYHARRSVFRPMAVAGCCVFVAVILWARANAVLATDDPSTMMSGANAVVVGVTLVALTLLLSGVLLPWRPPYGGGVVVGIMFSVVASGIVADGRIVAWDAAAALMATVGAMAVLQARKRWMGVLPLGIACGLSPLCVSVLVVLLLPLENGRRRAVDAVPAIAIGAAVAWVLQVTIGRAPASALAVGSDLGRIGSQNVWRFVAWWLDLAMPVVVLALIAIAAWFFADRADDTEGAAVTRTAAVWLLINVVVGLFLPRVVVGHGLLFALPVFLLAAGGYRALRSLPVDRSSWALSLFSAVCVVLPFALLWTPLRRAGEIAMVACGTS